MKLLVNFSRVVGTLVLLNSSILCLSAQSKTETSPAVPAKAQEKKPDAGQAAKAVPPPSATELNRRAQTLIDQGKVKEAVPLLQNAVALEPKNIQSWVFLGRAESLLQKFPEATKAFQTAVNLSPREPEFLFYLGSSQLDEAKYAAARASFWQALEMTPGDLRFRLGLSETYLQEKDYAAARRYLFEALGYAGDSTEVHARLGDLDEQENRHLEALDEYDAALRADPKNSSALYGRASALSGLKRFAEAEKIVRGELAKDAKNVTAHSVLAQVLDAEGKHRSAIEEYRTALALAPNSALLWGNLGWTQYEEGLLDEAVTSSRKALMLDPKQAGVRFNIGLAYAVRDLWGQAQKEYREGVDIAAPADIQAASSDLRDAMTKGHTTPAVKQALEYLTKSEWKLLGLEESLPALKPQSKGDR